MLSIADLAIIIVTLGVLTIAYFKWAFTYWERKGVPQVKPSIPFGNADNPFNAKKGTPYVIKDLYQSFKADGHKHGGLYIMTSPVYLPIDLEYVRNILSKDFHHFVDRGFYFNEKTDPLSAHLFSLEGQKWRHLRAKLTPTFTSGKMKMMFQTLLDCGEQLEEEVEKKRLNGEALDIKEMVACFTTDIIGSCAFGLDCNSFKDPDAEFRKYGRKLFTATTQMRTRVFLALSAPKLCKFFGMTLNPKDVRTFFMNSFRNVADHRVKNKIVRNDFLQLLLDMKDEKSDEGLTMEEMAAQAFLFFLAGFETSSTTMTFCFYELARNREVQRKLREEINSVMGKHNGKLTYEGVGEMKYMAQVVDETLRKYPPVPTLFRTCTQEYMIPDTDVVLETGTKVMVSTLSIQRDPEYYPDPDRFDPDRFTESNKAKRHPYAFLPFGEGPRNCIGLRFGLMQTKLGLASMLRNYDFTLNEKTPEVVHLNPKGGLLNTKEVIYLDVHPASNKFL